MSEAAQAQQRFQIQKIYIKDISFEIPGAPQIFQELQKGWKPDVNMQLNTNTQKLSETAYEVILSLTITAKHEDKTAFLIELHQAGVFGLDHFSEQQLGATLGAFCPSVLFPYARELVDSLLLRGGFPPLTLAPVNFEALYMQRLQQQQTARSANSAGSAAPADGTQQA